MKLVGIMPARNEDWILGASLRAALLWCDEMVVLDHASTDGTRAIINKVAAEHLHRVGLAEVHEPRWSEMAHRQTLLEMARMRGATHVAIIDADEILTGNLLPIIRSKIAALQPGELLQVGMLAMWRSLDHYRVGDSIWANRHDLTLAFADASGLNWNANAGYDHHHREPHGSKRLPPLLLDGGVMHMQWASWRRLVVKHCAYKMSERLKYPDKSVAEIDRMYSLALDERGLELERVPEDFWDAYADLRKYIDLYAEPWQERQCREWMAQHGAELFNGLDLFGVV